MPKTKKQYKDMDKYHEYKNRNQKATYKRGNYWDGERREYTIEEIEVILNHDIPDKELAKKLRRSMQGIQVMRCRLKHNKEAEEQA